MHEVRCGADRLRRGRLPGLRACAGQSVQVNICSNHCLAVGFAHIRFEGADQVQVLSWSEPTASDQGLDRQSCTTDDVGILDARLEIIGDL